MGQKVNSSKSFLTLRKYLEDLPLFLVILPLFLFIHIEQEHRHLITYRFVYREIIELSVVPFLFWGIGYLFMRHVRKSALLALLCSIVFYFFCDLKDWLHETAPGYFFERYMFLLPAIVILLGYAFIQLRRSVSTFKRTFLFANTLFVIFVLVDCLRILTDPSLTKMDLGDQKKTISSDYSACGDCLKPDIYYIVFDAYASSKILETEFKYNNHELDSFLDKNGFFTVHNSKSNYNLTPFSIACSFNLNYLRNVNFEKKISFKEYLPGLNAVYLSELTRILKKEGYEIINNSVFDIKNYPTINPPSNLWSIDLIYKRHNIFRKIDSDIGWLIRGYLNIKTIQQTNADYIKRKDQHFLNTFDSLLKTSEISSGKQRFVYGHLVLPHLPSAFDSVGNRVQLPVKVPSEEENRKRYLQLVSFSGKAIITIVQSILSNVNRPTVIIIQADHGYLFPDTSKKDLEFANLNAMYFYNQDYRMLYDSISNVNTFRVIFNTFFKKHYPLLKDTSYFIHK